MNYLAHGCRFLEDPAFVAGTALPDWLNVIARRTRVRQAQAAQFVQHSDPFLARLAAGVVQHHRDDHSFHARARFATLNWRFAAEIRDRLADAEGLRPMFLGHVLVEVLLDACIAQRVPQLLEGYYHALERLNPDRLQWAVCQIAPRPVPRVAWMLQRFLDEKFLYDYLSDAKLLMRLNQVMRRVSLPQLPEGLQQMFPAARQAVAEWLEELAGFQPEAVEIP